MEKTKNLCAQVPVDLIEKVRAERERLGKSNSEYVTMLLREYYEYKENGGIGMARENGATRTLAFQISEELFQRIKAHLERESARTGQRVTQKDFVIGLIVAALEEVERGRPGAGEVGESGGGQMEERKSGGKSGVAPDEDAGPVYGSPAPENLNAATRSPVRISR